MLVMKPYPRNKPDKSGYYMTYYHNFSKGENLYKALWYNWLNDEWIWREEMQVLYFLTESHNDFYTPCVTWCDDKKITYKQNMPT